MEPNIPTPNIIPPSQRTKGVLPKNQKEIKTFDASAPTIIHTMKSDAAKVIREHDETLVSITLAEEKKKVEDRTKEQVDVKGTERGETRLAPKPIKRVVVVVGGVLVVIGAILAFIFLAPALRRVNFPNVSFFGRGTPPAETAIPTQTATLLATSIIPAQSEKRLVINNKTAENIFALIATEYISGVAPGNIKNLFFVEEIPTKEGVSQAVAISANRLLLLAKTPTPEILARSLETPFMAGLLGEEGNVATPFFIFKVSGYATGVAGALAWEANLPNFFDMVFGTKFLTGNSEEVRFRDVVIAGHDTRIFEGTPTKSIAYTFADPRTIVVAGSSSALAEIVSFVLAR